MNDMLPMTGGLEPRRGWNDQQPTEGPASRRVWSESSLASWLKRTSAAGLTLSEAWQLSRELCRGPLADVWNDGARRGCTYTCNGRVE